MQEKKRDPSARSRIVAVRTDPRRRGLNRAALVVLVVALRRARRQPEAAASPAPRLAARPSSCRQQQQPQLAHVGANALPPTQAAAGSEVPCTVGPIAFCQAGSWLLPHVGPRQALARLGYGRPSLVGLLPVEQGWPGPRKLSRDWWTDRSTRAPCSARSAPGAHKKVVGTAQRELLFPALLPAQEPRADPSAEPRRRKR